MLLNCWQTLISVQAFFLIVSIFDLFVKISYDQKMFVHHLFVSNGLMKSTWTIVQHMYFSIKSSVFNMSMGSD